MKKRGRTDLVFLSVKRLSDIGYRLSEAFQLYGEVAHEGCLLGDCQTTGDGLTAVIDILERSSDDLHMVVGINAARDTEAYQIQAREAVLASLRVAVS